MDDPSDSKMYVSYGNGSGEFPRFDGLNIDGGKDCKLQRPRSSERDASQGVVSVENLAFVLTCPEKVSIVKANNKVIYANEDLTKESGNVIKSFSNFEQTEFILMFEDLSLRFVK
jgi:flagellar biosynthesis/type III secretory pathway ATPase